MTSFIVQVALVALAYLLFPVFRFLFRVYCGFLLLAIVGIKKLASLRSLGRTKSASGVDEFSNKVVRAEDQQQVPSRRDRQLSKVLAWASIFIVPCAIAFWPARPQETSSDTPPEAHEVAYESPVPIFDYSRCVSETTSSLGYDYVLTPHRDASVKWFCSRQWNTARIYEIAALLQSSGLTLCRVLVAVDPQNPRAKDCAINSYPSDFRAFVIVFDSIPILEILNEIHHPLPTRRTGSYARIFGPIIKRDTGPFQERIKSYVSGKNLPIDMDENLTATNSEAREYTYSGNSPEIRIITDVGLQTSLSDIYRAAYFGPAPTSHLHHRSGTDLSAIDPGAELDTNFSMGLVSIEASAFLAAGGQMRVELTEDGGVAPPPVRSLTLVLLGHESKPNKGGSYVADRQGWYDPETGTAGVTQLVALSLNKRQSTAALASQIGRLSPSALTHEIYHHIFYRPSIASSGFLLEGEATAYGEYVHQMIMEGALSDPNDPILVLNKKIASQLHETNGIPTAEQLANLEQLQTDLQTRLEERGKSARFTSVQCQLLRVAASDNSLPRLQDALTLTSADLQVRPDVSQLYALAWAVYDFSRRNQPEWQTELEEIHHRIRSHQSMGDIDRSALNDIEAQTQRWATIQMRQRKECH